MEGCRICGGDFFPKPLLTYDGAPRAAQGFLNVEQLVNDAAVNLKIWQCTQCGTVQHNLSPVDYYREVIRSIAFSPEMRTYRLEQLGSWLQLYTLNDANILEIGSGRGEYLELLKECGAKSVEGIEYSKVSCELATDKGLKVYKGYLDHTGTSIPPGTKYQGFVTFSFMEHWPNPNASLKALSNLMSDGAIGLVEVPNFNMILQKGLYSEFTIDHIFYFDKKSLTFMLEKNGYEVLSIDVVWYNYILSAVVRKRPPLQIKHFEAVQNRVASQLRAYIERFNPKSVVVWGAGHQALAVITIAKISENIRYIVDSAPFKQEKYTPASHILIKSPDYLLEDTPEAVIVMAAGFSAEVISTLRQRYGHIQELAILGEDELEILD